MWIRFWMSLQWLIHIINSFDKAKFSCILLPCRVEIDPQFDVRHRNTFEVSLIELNHNRKRF